jgi:hypothetical protein
MMCVEVEKRSPAKCPVRRGFFVTEHDTVEVKANAPIHTLKGKSNVHSEYSPLCGYLQAPFASRLLAGGVNGKETKETTAAIRQHRLRDAD